MDHEKKSPGEYGITEEDLEVITQYLQKNPYERSASDLMKPEDT